MTSRSVEPWFVLVLGALVAGSLLVTCGTITPREGWNERWGPLVPHESFPGDCSLCHLPDRWDRLRDDFSFDHAKETGVPLKGAHDRAACLRCHNDFGPVTAYTSRGCSGCHLDVHGNQLGGECTQCHNEESWRPEGLIAEHARTRFPLFGAHASAACELCHTNAPTGDYRGAPTRCELCHRDMLAQAQSPDHAAAGWTTGCERCHVPSTWGGAGFIHNYFPLTGGHAIQDCSRCHVGGNFAISAACYSCHQTDYEGAPNHVAGNYSQSCQACHNTVAWQPAFFDHTFFPLTGGHALNDCSRCHVGGNFNLSAACYSCHQTDYEGAPNHVSSNYSQTCQTCHSTAAWRPASFNHRFPLSGPHNLSCNECHPGGNTAVYTCIDCHEHERTRMDDKHSEVRNYTYTSQACVQCHPNGRH